MESDAFATLVRREADTASRSVRAVELNDVIEVADRRPPTLARRVPVRLLVAAVVVIAIVIPAARLWSGASPHGSLGGVPGTTMPQPPAPTLAQLLSGKWRALAAAPSPIGTLAAVAWTGKELVVWGGYKRNFGNGVPSSDGEVYDPRTGVWTKLPPAPLKPAAGAAAVWTGSEVIIVGGGSQTSVYDQAAAFDPATDTWQELAAPPVAAREQMSGFWTGTSAIFLGGNKADHHSYDDGASYSPTSDSWTYIPGPRLPASHPLDWPTYVQTGNQLIDFSAWLHSFKLPNGGGSNSGVDTFVYDSRHRTWRLLAHRASDGSPPPAPIEGVWTGETVVLQGFPYNCGGCRGPNAADYTEQFHPNSGHWTSASPQDNRDEVTVPGSNYYPDYSGVAWLGKSMFAFVPVTGDNGEGDADATVYDPVTNRWRALPAAPFACGTGGGTDSVTWTGSQVVVICVPTSGDASGLVFSLAAHH
jgi:hypothetical protein